MSMEVPRLNDLCVGKITTHVWSTQLHPEFVVKYVAEAVKQQNQTEVQPNPMKFKQFFDRIDDIVNQIMDMQKLPKRTGRKLSLSFLNLVKDMAHWCKILPKILCLDLTYKNWIYVMHKTQFTSLGNLDRARTMIKVLFDTYGNIKVNHQIARFHCLITTYTLDNYIKNNKYIKSKRLINKIKKKSMKMTMSTDEMCRRTIYRYHNRFFTDGTLEHVEICYNYLIQPDRKKVQWLCQNALTLSECKVKLYYSEKIIFVYNHLDEVTWNKLLSMQYLTIIWKLFISGHDEYCLLFYKQITTMKPETAIKILKKLFEEICSLTNNSGCSKVFKENQKYILFRIWEYTPDDLKKDFIKSGPVFYDKCGYMFSELQDYSLCSMFINDRVHSEEDKMILIHFLILNNKVNYSNCEENGCIKELLKDFNMTALNFNEHSSRALFARCAQWICTDAVSDDIFGDSVDMIDFREKISKDPKFVIEVISNFESLEGTDIMIPLHNFLIWCFKTLEYAMRFIVDHLLNSEAMIKVYTDYLPRLQQEPSCKRLFILDYVFMEEKIASQLLPMITNPHFFHKTLESIMKKGNDIDVSGYLKFMCDAKEKEAIMASYLLTESTVRLVLQKHVYTPKATILHSGFTENCYLKTTVIEALKLRNCWLYSRRLRLQFGEYMTLNSKRVYNKYFKIPTLLPNQTASVHKSLVNARYKILMTCILGEFSQHLVEDLFPPYELASLSEFAVEISNGLNIDFDIIF